MTDQETNRGGLQIVAIHPIPDFAFQPDKGQHMQDQDLEHRVAILENAVLALGNALERHIETTARVEELERKLAAVA